MIIKPSDWYSEDYFYPNKRKYVDQFGVEREYIGPSKDWHGFSEIALFVRENFESVRTIYDIGCSAGSFVSRSREHGFSSFGCDISKFAISNCIDGAKGFVKVKDITKSEQNEQYDAVVAFDLLEHIYEKDLDKCLQYIYQSAKIEGWFFFCIATSRNPNEIWSHPDENTPIPPDRTWLAVSGHVHIKPIEWWIKKLESVGMKTSYEKMMKFQLWRNRHSQMRDVESWSTGNVYIGRKA